MTPIRALIYLLFFSITALLTGCSGCTEQHNPRPHWEEIEAERKQANAPQPVLEEDGTIPEPVAEDTAEANPVMTKYVNFCGSCHGPTGMGDGVAAAGLNPKPRNLHEKQWQASVDDAHITKVIKEGGAAVGLSATMAPWGAVLTDEEIAAMVEIIRGWGQG